MRAEKEYGRDYKGEKGRKAVEREKKRKDKTRE